MQKRVGRVMQFTDFAHVYASPSFLFTGVFPVCVRARAHACGVCACAVCLVACATSLPRSERRVHCNAGNFLVFLSASHIHVGHHLSLFFMR